MARRAARLLVALLAVAAAPPRRAAGQQLRLAQVPVSGRLGLDSLARLGFEIADVRVVDGRLTAVVVVSDATQRLLAARGMAAAPVAAAAAPVAADTFHVFRSFDKAGTGIRATLAAWAAADTLIHVDSVGASLEGRPILAVKVGSAADAPSRPNVLFMGTHHAREWVSTEVAMRLIRWLADSLPRPLLASRDLWVIPVENPDGYQYTFTVDRLWRKNRRLNGDGTYGVDLNRNYPAFWGVDDAGSSPVPGTEIYRGGGPASEPETQAIIAFHSAHPPVLAVSYHTYTDLVLYPYGFRSGELPPDQPVYQALAGTDLDPAVHDGVAGSSLPAYHPGPGWTLYTTNGEYTDWAYRAHGTLAFTTELTSGCCTPDSGFYYGFVFPDDSAMVERVFRDNLPFAMAVIAAASDPGNAAGPAGMPPSAPRVESVWPEARISMPAAGPIPFSLTVRTATGQFVTRSAQADTLWRGRLRISWRSDVRIDSARAVRVDGAGLAAELITLAGAENGETGWAGWSHTSDALVGTAAWYAGGADTLTSPVTDLRGRDRVWLQFWSKHAGSGFALSQRGLVQFSPDSGRTWSDVAALAGSAPAWYPVRVDLPTAAGAAGARVRFVSAGMPWWVDAAGFASDSTTAFQLLAAAGGADVSENPVRGDQVVIYWPAGTTPARVGVYTFTGQRLLAATVVPPNNEFVWDLTAGGRRMPNGAYLVVVEVDGRVLRRRLFLTRRAP
jgi:zinc carboxypeptidase